MPFLTRRELLLCGLCSAATVGCGTVLHPERRGQAAGPLDWKIVALDAVGLLFFFVPGVIAFAVDFSNGTIYLPTESYSRTGRRPGETELQKASVPTDDSMQAEIERVVSQHAGRDVRLQPGKYETRPMQDIDEFGELYHALADA